MKLIFNDSETRYSQNPQTKTLKFSFLRESPKGVFYQIFRPFQCRDYFSDCIVGTAAAAKISAYGFTFDPKYTALDDDKLKLSIEAKGECLDSIASNIHLLHEYEVSFNQPPCEFNRIDDQNAILLASSYWQESPIRMNLYTLILKLLCYQTDNVKSYIDLFNWENFKESGIEITYLKKIQKNIDDTFKNIKDLSLEDICRKLSEANLDIADLYKRYMKFCKSSLVRYDEHLVIHSNFGIISIVTSLVNIYSSLKSAESISESVYDWISVDVVKQVFLPELNEQILNKSNT